jgi:hypothetical protein
MKYSDFKKLSIGDCVKYKDCYYTLSYIIDAIESPYGEGYSFKFSHTIKGNKQIMWDIPVYKNEKNNGNIKVEDFSIVSKDEFDLSKYKYEESTNLEEAIKKFQKDIKKFSKDGDISYVLNIPVEGGPIDLEIKRSIK